MFVRHGLHEIVGVRCMRGGRRGIPKEERSATGGSTMKKRVGVLVAMAVGLAVSEQGMVGVHAQEAVSTTPAMTEQAAGPSQAAPKIVATNTTKTYHQAACRLASKIKPAHRVEFVSVEEAQKAGYTPCKVCWRAKGAQHANAGNIAQ